jgi:hypothetical protein
MINMKIVKDLYNYVYAFFYHKLSSDKYTSASASISILTMLSIVITLILINIGSNYLFKVNFIKEVNEWIVLMLIIALYLIYRFSILKILKRK